MLERFAAELQSSPAQRELYATFRPRLLKMSRTAEIGWGYGDAVQDTVKELEQRLGD